MSQLGTTSTNNNPVIGGSGVTKVTADGTMGPCTVDVASLAADTEYHFEQSLDSQTWVALSPADWLFAGLAPGDGTEVVATYMGTDLPGFQFFRIVATPALTN